MGTIALEISSINNAKSDLADALIATFGMPKTNFYNAVGTANEEIKRLANWSLTDAQITLANALVFTKDGLGDDATPNTQFDGSTVKTISYNTIGALEAGYRDIVDEALSILSSEISSLNTKDHFDELTTNHLNSNSASVGILQVEELHGNLPGGPYLPLEGGTMSGRIILSKNESNEISLVYNNNGVLSTQLGSLASIRNALDFKWYNSHYLIGNIRGSGENSIGFGITEGNNNCVFRVNSSNAWVNNNTVLHSGNSSISGNTITINGTSTTWTRDGGDADTLDGLHEYNFVRAGSYNSGTFPDILTTNRSFVGTVNETSEGWQNIISVRHRNNTGDGPSYGMAIKSPLKSAGNLSWAQQCNSWKWKTLIDDSNLDTYLESSPIISLLFAEISSLSTNDSFLELTLNHLNSTSASIGTLQVYNPINGVISNADYASGAGLLVPNQNVSTTSYLAGTWTPPAFSSYKKIWLEEFRSSQLNNDTGDLVLALRNNGSVTELCMAIDGTFYQGTGKYKVLDSSDIPSLISGGWVNIHRTLGLAKYISWSRIGKFITTSHDNSLNDALIEIYISGDLNYPYGRTGKLICNSYGTGSRSLILTTLGSNVNGQCDIYVTVDEDSYIWIGSNSMFTGLSKYRVLHKGSFVEFYSTGIINSTTNPRSVYLKNGGGFRLLDGTVTVYEDYTTVLNSERLNEIMLADFPYAVHGSSHLGTSEETGNSDNLARTMFWRDNARSRIGVSIFHSESSSYAFELSQPYNSNRVYVRNKLAGTWKPELALAFYDEVSELQASLDSLATKDYFEELKLGHLNANSASISVLLVADLLNNQYVKKDGDTMTGTLHMKPTTSNYTEGIRFYGTAKDSTWSNVHFGCDPASSTGTHENLWFLGRNSSNQFIIDKGGSANTTFCINTSKNIGIGTGSPSLKLTVNGDTYTDKLWTVGFSRNWNDLYATGRPWYGASVFDIDGTRKYGFHSAGYFGWYALTGGGSIAMLENGNVGISINSPLHKLDVNGDIYSNHRIMASAHSATSPTEQGLVVNGTGGTDVADTPGLGFHNPNQNLGTLKFLNDGSFRFYNNGCTSYRPVYASTFYGNLSGVATTATNLESKPVINWVDSAGSTETTKSKISITIGDKTSDAVLIGKVNQAYSADSAGKVSISTSSVSNTRYLLFTSGTTGSLSVYTNTGIYVTPSTKSLYASAFYETSDYDLKENISKISDLHKAKNIEFIEFNFKDSPTKKYGVIAQQLLEIGLDNLVSGEDFLAVDYISMLCLKIAQLEDEIKKLKLIQNGIR